MSNNIIFCETIGDVDDVVPKEEELVELAANGRNGCIQIINHTTKKAWQLKLPQIDYDEIVINDNERISI